MRGVRIAAIAALVPAGAATQVSLPPEVTDGASVSVAEIRANSDVVFDRLAGPDGGVVARERFVGLALPPDLVAGGVDRATLDKLFDMLDANGDGSVTRAEWSEQIHRQLGFADENGDGRITLDELARVRENLDLGDALGIVF